MSRILIIGLLLSSLNLFGQILREKIPIEGMELIDHSGEFQLAYNQDTFNIHISSLRRDSSTLHIFKITSRRIKVQNRTEIIVEYSFSNGAIFDNQSSGSDQIIVLDSLTGKQLFHCMNYLWHMAGTNYTQGFTSCGYYYNVKFNENGTIELFDLNVRPETMRTNNGVIIDLPSPPPDKETGIYSLKNGAYSL
jgi:hypothetical protein